MPFAEVDLEGEISRARNALDGVEMEVLGHREPLTLSRLAEGLDGVDVLYLVCHGVLKNGEPYLYLQNPDGTAARVEGVLLAERVAECVQPRLIVLASCQSAGTESGTDAKGRPTAQTALAPRLMAAGTPAVLAMQGNISMPTVEKMMPVFFEALLTDGRIDRALAIARARVRDEMPDAWMPALYLRLKRGLLWEDAASEKQPRPGKLVLVGILAFLGLAVLGYGARVFLDDPNDEVKSLFEHPVFRDLTPNPGLVDFYQPGNVLQIVEDDGQGGERELETPRLFLRASDCFPELSVESSPFALEPFTLHDDTRRLAMSNSRMLTTTRPDLSRNFAPDCVAELRRVLLDGDRIEWFAIVERALVADDKSGAVPVLGYAARPLKPVYDELPEAPPDVGEILRAGLSLLLVEGRSATPVDFEHGFRPGDFFRFEITAETDGWLSVLARASEGAELAALWPGSEGKAQRVHAGEKIAVPAKPNAFQFTDGTENEIFYVTLAGGSGRARADMPEERDPKEIVDFAVRGLTRSLASTRKLDAEGPLDARSVRFEASAGEGTAAVALRLRREGS